MLMLFLVWLVCDGCIQHHHWQKCSGGQHLDGVGCPSPAIPNTFIQVLMNPGNAPSGTHTQPAFVCRKNNPGASHPFLPRLEPSARESACTSAMTYQTWGLLPSLEFRPALRMSMRLIPIYDSSSSDCAILCRGIHAFWTCDRELYRGVNPGWADIDDGAC